MKPYGRLQASLLRWYRRHKRDLPWRRTRDPYAIWVSEIMLQQTTVEAVIPYYERFLKRFPDVKTLAQASEDEVLRLWSGLGYYSRARNLLRAAVLMNNSPHPPLILRGGERGSYLGDLQNLPGIGRYTAGAIASIAFDIKAPIVDGNVIRVLARVFAIGKDPKSTVGQKIFWKKAEDILPDSHCGDFNQALMELGATLCLPDHPHCPVCPIAAFCGARKARSTDRYPRRQARGASREVVLSAAIIRKDDKILFVRRPQTGLLKGLWEIPMSEAGIEGLARSFSLRNLHALPAVRHSVLNRRLRILPFLAEAARSLKTTPRRVWLATDRLDNLPMSSMNRKILHTIKVY